MNDPRLDRLLEMMERQQMGGDNISSGNRGGDRSYGQKIDELVKSSSEATKQFHKMHSSLRLTSKSQFEYRMAQEDARKELYQLEDALRKHRNGTRLLNADQLKSVEARRKELESTQKQSQAGTRFANALTQWGGFLINYFTQVQTATIQGISNVLSTVQAGGSGFAIANAQMAMQLDIANAQAQGMAQATQMAGMAVMGLPTIGAKIAGAGIMLKGQADAAASSLKTMAEKAYNQLLMTGGEQVLKAYKDLTKAGLIVAGGADAMNEALRGRGGKLVISFDELNRMVQENTAALARSRMGVGEAALMMGRVAKVVREQKLERGLTAIGIGIEEFGGIVASTMADMRYNNPNRVLNIPELTAKSLEYAKQLALLSTLTGKSVKELKDRGKEAEGELAYQNFMARFKDPKLKEAFDQLPAFVRKSAVELATFGNIRNEQGRLMAQTVPGFQTMVQEFAAGFKTGRITIDDVINIQSKYAKIIVDGVRNNATLNAIAAAGNTKLEGFTNELSRYTIEIEGFTQDVNKVRKGVNATFDEAAEGAKGGKETITQVLTDIENAGKTLVANFQGEIIDRIPLIGQMIKDALAKANKLVEEGPEALKGKGLPNYDGLVKMLVAGGILLAVAQVVGQFLLSRYMMGKQTKLLTEAATKAQAQDAAKAVKESAGKITETAGKAQTTGRVSSIIDPSTGKPFELGPSPEQLKAAAAAEKSAAQAARQAKILETTAKATKVVKGVAVVGTVVAAGEGVMRGAEVERKYERGEITRKEAYAQQTGIATEVAGGLTAAYAGGKVGAIVGGLIGAWFGGVAAVPGALIGGILGSIGGALTYYLTDAKTWVRKTGEQFSRWWQSWSFKGIWDSIGKGLESGMSTVGNWASSAMSKVRGWFSSDNQPSAPPPPKPGQEQAGAVLSGNFKFFKQALIVALAEDVSNPISLTSLGQQQLTTIFGTVLQNVLKGGPTSVPVTKPTTTGFYDPKTKQGKVFDMESFIEYGKGDPMLYAFGKMLKLEAEMLETMKAVARGQGIQVDKSTDSLNVLNKLRRAQAFQ